MRATLSIAFVAILARPATWPLALLTFLVRGGLLLAAAPILVLPSAVGLANVILPWLNTLVFVGLTGPILVGIVGGAVGIGTWIVAGGWLAAAAELEGIRLVADEDEVAGGDRRRPLGPGRSWRIVLVRWLVSVPLLIATTYAVARLLPIAYHELTSPSSVELPVAVRVAAGAPDALVVVVLVWAIGGLVSGLAARYLVLDDAGIGGALRSAIGEAVRHPVRSLVVFGVPLATQVVVLSVVVVAASAAWGLARSALTDGGPIVAVGAVLGLTLAWAIGLALLGVVGAWRAAALTVMVARTFGGATDGQAGDWRRTAASATMADLRPGGSFRTRGDG